MSEKYPVLLREWRKEHGKVQADRKAKVLVFATMMSRKAFHQEFEACTREVFGFGCNLKIPHFLKIEYCFLQSVLL